MTCVCAQMFLGLSVVAAGRLAHVCCPGPACNVCCALVAAAFRTPWRERGMHLGEHSVLTAFVPISHLISISTEKDIGFHF